MAGIVNGLVTSGASAVQFTPESVPLKSLLIYADELNSGNVFVGTSAVTTLNSPPLKPGKFYEFEFRQTETETAGDLSDFYLDATVGGDKATYIGISL